jgi:hypothetical protein
MEIHRNDLNFSTTASDYNNYSVTPQGGVQTNANGGSMAQSSQYGAQPSMAQNEIQKETEEAYKHAQEMGGQTKDGITYAATSKNVIQTSTPLTGGLIALIVLLGLALIVMIVLYYKKN